MSQSHQIAYSTAQVAFEWQHDLAREGRRLAVRAKDCIADGKRQERLAGVEAKARRVSQCQRVVVCVGDRPVEGGELSFES